MNESAEQTQPQAKPNKKTQEPNVWSKAPECLKPFVAIGIPLLSAHFQGSVNNSKEEPESNFSLDSGSASRRVDMLLHPNGILCHQRGKYFGVPLPMVKFYKFK